MENFKFKVGERIQHVGLHDKVHYATVVECNTFDVKVEYEEGSGVEPVTGRRLCLRSWVGAWETVPVPTLMELGTKVALARVAERKAWLKLSEINQQIDDQHKIFVRLQKATA